MAQGCSHATPSSAAWVLLQWVGTLPCHAVHAKPQPWTRCASLLSSCPPMVLVRIFDSVWLEGPSAATQNQQHEATKAQLAEAQAAASRLDGELSSVQAEYEAACSAKAELVKERGQLEKRVRPGAGQVKRGWDEMPAPPLQI